MLKTIEEMIGALGSVEHVARYLEIPLGTISRWRTGKSKPSPAMIRVAKAKGIELRHGYVDPYYVPELKGIDIPKKV